MARRILIAAAALAVVFVGLAAALYWSLSGDAVRRALEREGSRWAGEPVQIGQASVAFVPRPVLRLGEVRVGNPVRITLASVQLTVPFRALFSRRISGGALAVTGSRVEMPLRAGIARQQGSPGAAALAIRVDAVRDIRLRDITVVSRGHAIVLDADVSLVGSRLEINRFSAASGAMALEAGGYAELEPRINVTVEATANTVAVDELLALVAAFAGDGAPGSGPGPSTRVFARVLAPRARVAGVDLAQFHATIVAEGGQITVDPLTFDAFGGRYDGWLDVQPEALLQVRIGAGAANMDVAQLSAFAGAPGAVTGRLTGSGRFGATGRDLASVLASARGVGQAVITGGTMRGLDVVETTARFLGRAPRSTGTAAGERFDQILGTFALSDRILRSDDLTLRAADYDMLARGTLVLGTTALDGRADLVLSEALSATAPPGVVRYARAGSRIVLPAIITGTLAQPRIGIDAGAALRRGVVNEVERRLESLRERFGRERPETQTSPVPVPGR